MGLYIGFIAKKQLLAKEGSIDQVVAWGRVVLAENAVVKIGRVSSGLVSIKIIADLTKEGISYVRTPRCLPHSVAKKLCRSARTKI